MVIEAVIVVYNKRIYDSLTYKRCISIADCDVRLCIVDNSTRDYSNGEYAQKNGLKYISMGGNKGLSKAYNKAIDACPEVDVLVLFDDDTDVCADYFRLLKSKLIECPDADIFAPIVFGQDGIIYSPNEYHFLKNDLVLNQNKPIRQSKFNAISSCLAIRKRVFDNYRYDERLFVDLVDQYFCLEQRKAGRKFEMVDVVINQNFSQRSPDLNPEKYWGRMKIRLKDIATYSMLMGGEGYRLLGYIKSCGICVQTGMHTKSIRLFLMGIVESTKRMLEN